MHCVFHGIRLLRLIECDLSRDRSYSNSVKQYKSFICICLWLKKREPAKDPFFFVLKSLMTLMTNDTHDTPRVLKGRYTFVSVLDDLHRRLVVEIFARLRLLSLSAWQLWCKANAVWQARLANAEPQFTIALIFSLSVQNYNIPPTHFIPIHLNSSQFIHFNPNSS